MKNLLDLIKSYFWKNYNYQNGFVDRFQKNKQLSNKPILIILPSRGRSKRIEHFYRSWRKTTSGLSEVLTCLDEDDQTLKQYKVHKDISYDVGEGKTLVNVSNRAFRKYPNFKYYFLPSDDHIIRTAGWEKKFIKKIKENGGKGVAYGNDLLQKDKIATAAFVSGNVFRAVGYVCPPDFIHMYIDVFWTEVGKRLHKLFYFPEIIIEHMHFSVGKSKADKQYLSVNNKKIADYDKKMFETWVMRQMKSDIAKIKKYKD